MLFYDIFYIILNYFNYSNKLKLYVILFLNKYMLFQIIL